MLSRLIAVLAFLAPAFAAQAENPQMLRIQWQESTTYRLETLTETSFQKPGETSAPQVMKVTQGTTLSVRNDPPSTNRLVLVKFTSVKGEMNSGSQHMVFDSSKPGEGNPMLGQAIGRAVGKSFALVYDDQDRFRDSRELGNISSMSGSITSLSALADSRDVANLFRKSMEIGLPPIPVSIGDTWASDETMIFPQAGDTHVELNGKFEGIEEREGHKQAKIAFEGKLSTITRKDKPIAKIEIAEGSTMSGVVFYDLDRHITSYSAYNTHLKLIVAGVETPFDQHIVSKLLSVESTK